MTGRDFTSGTQLAYSDKWKNDLDIYLQWLYEAFALLHLLLAEHGSLYVHLDWRATHYAKIILDEIFGVSPSAEGGGFKSEIIWHYQTGGERRGSQKRNHMRKHVDPDGHITWTIRSAGRLYTYDEDTIMTLSDVWSDISHLHQKDPERNGYATQTPAALLERIILASSEEGDLVLDCFCGSGVTPLVAERLGRRWIASDQSPLAMQVTQKRLQALEQCCPFVLQRSEE
ncbi:MAG: site-specific DNA-methyltransferase [Chloroflexota bacterium]|nr:MAG: site-specific DNA-methyltransferase [Chloroflexota bacterium]